MRRYRLTFEESEAREIEALAREYGLTEQAVLEQLVAVGLEQVRDEHTDDEPRLRE
ncbi:CopG family transcriptional regulator [Halorarius halobius]|uniref:CopG family transcriptional regulator n=1 Tax=Halorarius halobius TaxID=2962671 RepID=UPI0020CD6F66|nr:CopG family transcriptional regulator [Halorarius halobius]